MHPQEGPCVLSPQGSQAPGTGQGGVPAGTGHSSPRVACVPCPSAQSRTEYCHKPCSVRPLALPETLGS